MVVVPDGEQDGATTNEHTLHATNIWDEVEYFVAIARYDSLIQIHLDGDTECNLFV